MHGDMRKMMRAAHPPLHVQVRLSLGKGGGASPRTASLALCWSRPCRALALLQHAEDCAAASVPDCSHDGLAAERWVVSVAARQGKRQWLAEHAETVWQNVLGFPALLTAPSVLVPSSSHLCPHGQQHQPLPHLRLL